MSSVTGLTSNLLECTPSVMNSSKWTQMRIQICKRGKHMTRMSEVEKLPARLNRPPFASALFLKFALPKKTRGKRGDERETKKRDSFAAHLGPPLR